MMGLIFLRILAVVNGLIAKDVALLLAAISLFLCFFFLLDRNPNTHALRGIIICLRSSSFSQRIKGLS